MEIELANNDDLVKVRAGTMSTDEVRDCTIEGWVDTGAVRLVLPKVVADSLGLRTVRKTGVRFADNRRGTRDIVGDVWLKLLDREGVFTAIVEPNREDALIGAIVLEELDMLADPVAGTCHPRDPDMVISEIEEYSPDAETNASGTSANAD